MIVLGILLLGSVWLNGPGFRTIAPWVAVRFLEKSGIKGDFKFNGSLVGGMSLSDLKIESDGVLSKITVDKINPSYRWRGLIRGELEGLDIEGVHVDLRLDAKPSKEDKTLDLKQLVETIRSSRPRFIPLEVDIKDLSITATNLGKPVMQVAKSRAHHEAGAPNLTLELGVITDATGRVWTAQSATIEWKPDEIAIARIDPIPGVSLRDLVVQTPAGGEPSADARVMVDDAVFVLSTTPGFASATADLREGSIDIAPFAKRLGFDIPLEGNLTSFAVEADHILPQPANATGVVRLLLEKAVYKEWTTPQLSVDATLEEARASVVAHANLLDSGVAVEASAPVARDVKTFTLGDATGQFHIEDVPAVLRGLSKTVPAIDPDAAIPPSRIDGKFSIGFMSNRASRVDVEASLQPIDKELATPVVLKVRWLPEKPLAIDLTADGLTGNVNYDSVAGTYEGTASFESFTSKRIIRWLGPVKVQLPGTANLGGTWRGDGEIPTGKHRGDLTLTAGSWTREGAAPITASGGIQYDWPVGFETHDLQASMSDEKGAQKVVLDAGLKNGLLELHRFLWTSGTDELAEGKGSLPVPADFSKWRETLAHDSRPISVNISSRVLPLAKLKGWIPQLERLDPRSTGQLDVAISGTYAAPVIDAKLEAHDLRSPAQPQLPPADLKLVLTGRDGRLTLEGAATAPDFAPAEIKASLPFHPSQWAGDPNLFLNEPISARVDMPRLDLSRFASLIPDTVKVTGVLTGNAIVAGTLGKPDIKGSLDLTGGAVKFKDERFPEIGSLEMAVEAVPDRITLKSFRAAIAGGSVAGDGSLAITGGKLGELTLNARGDHLPVVRNELLILRANANLSARGPWDRATVSGTLGLVDGVFYRDIELLPIGRPFTGPSAAELPRIDTPQARAESFPEPFRNWGLNVALRTERPFLIRGNLATGQITGSAKIGGTFGSPAPSGRFLIEDVRASLPFSTLYVRSGTATFTPASGFDPILDLRGTAEPRPYVVTIYVYGRASDPQMLLTSTPPMPENEIMTLLATGTTTSGLEDPQAASSRALQLFIEELRRGRFRFGKQLRPLLKMLDRVDFSLAESDPYSTESFSTATVSLTDRWYLSAGVGANGDSRGMLVWRLSFR